MKKEKPKILILIGIILVVFSICTMQLNNSNFIRTSASAQNEKTIGWGIKRSDRHEQPDVGAENKRILEENGGICLGKNMEKNIYLTFDSGYEAGYTENILNTLKDNNVKATFFITSHYLNTAENIVQKMIDEGHIVGNHF